MPDAKGIFQYRHPLTGAVVHADPVGIKRALTLVMGGSVNAVLEQWQSGDLLARAQAEERLLDAVRAVFEFPPLTQAGEGVTDQQCLDVLQGFLDFFA